MTRVGITKSRTNNYAIQGQPNTASDKKNLIEWKNKLYHLPSSETIRHNPWPPNFVNITATNNNRRRELARKRKRKVRAKLASL